MKKEIVIDIQGLSKTYNKGQKEVLSNLNLQIYQGEIFGFIGRNGIGKSTTIKCMIGINEFEKGDIILKGHSIKLEPIEAKKVFGYVPDSHNLYEGMTGREYINFIASIYQTKKEGYEEKFNHLVKRFQIENDIDRLIGEYSHGMRQKISLISAVIHDPDIWILDEPMVGLDIMVQKELVTLMKEFKQSGRTVFLTSHNIDIVQKLCDRVAIINGGNIAIILDENDFNTKGKEGLEEIFFQYSKD